MFIKKSIVLWRCFVVFISITEESFIERVIKLSVTDELGGGNISTLKSGPLKLVDNLTYQGSTITLTKNDINTGLEKTGTAIDRLSVIWKTDLTDKIKRSFFQAAVVSILLYGCITWTLTKRIEKKLDGNYTRMLRAVLYKSWRQHPTKQQCTATYHLSRKLSKLDEPDTTGEVQSN